MRRIAAVACLAAAFVIGGCRTEAPAAKVMQAAPASAVREGAWLGGPEPLSGKLRSGLVTWWRLQPVQPLPGQPFELTVRVEEARLAGATLAIDASEGPAWPAPKMPAWAVPVGAPSEVRVRLTAPAGASYVHLTLHQGERTAVRSILLPLTGRNPAEAARQRPDYGVDAAGEPIVRMPADKAR